MFVQKWHGPFQSEPVLRAFTIYFTSHGIQAEVPANDPGKGCRPIGALALAATAVSNTNLHSVTKSYQHPPGGVWISNAHNWGLHVGRQQFLIFEMALHNRFLHPE